MNRRHFIGKTVLRNVIRHTDAHNRAVEEDECWRLYNARCASDVQNKTSVKRENIEANSSTQFQLNVQSQSASQHSEQMDHLDHSGTTNYWMHKFHAVESSDKERWDHSGYKELYPEEFSVKHRLPRSSDKSGKELTLKEEKRRKCKCSSCWFIILLQSLWCAWLAYSRDYFG
jgi:hypothetical protein